MNNQIFIYRGDSSNVSLTAYAADGVTPFSLSGYNIKLTVKQKDTDTTNVLQFNSASGSSVLTSSLTAGIVTFVFTTSDTTITPSNYVYDVQVTSGTNVYTIAKDKFIIGQDVTN